MLFYVAHFVSHHLPGFLRHWFKNRNNCVTRIVLKNQNHKSRKDVLLLFLSISTLFLRFSWSRFEFYEYELEKSLEISIISMSLNGTFCNNDWKQSSKCISTHHLQDEFFTRQQRWDVDCPLHVCWNVISKFNTFFGWMKPVQVIELKEMTDIRIN